MTAWVQREYTQVAELRGPLLVVRGVDGVGWDEFATIRMETGQTRHGLVLEVDRDLAVVQVLEGTEGMRPTATRVSFSGSPLRVPVGPDWLGRVCNGRGEPIDGGPPVTGEVSLPVAGSPINPVLREPPAEPVLTGISVIDALTTLVRGQKLPIFSVAGLPHLELRRSWPPRRLQAAIPSAWSSRRWGSPTPTRRPSVPYSRSAPQPASWYSC